MTVSRGLTCREVVELVSDYLDDVLPDDERHAVDSHLAGCVGCSIVLGEVRETIRMTGMLTEDHLTAEQRRTLLEAFRGWTFGDEI